MQNLDKGQIKAEPYCNTGRILELYGSLGKFMLWPQISCHVSLTVTSAEVYQTSAMHPSQTVHFLTTKNHRPIPLPGNVSHLKVRDVGIVPLPYPEDFFSHIRATTLPSLIPSANLPELFRECYKLLAPGGLLELRLIDASPVRQTAGPLMRSWIEDRLSDNLEKLFRCSKPSSLVPMWLTDVGFELMTTDQGQTATFPCAIDTSCTDIVQELSTTVGRTVWKEVWGSFVEQIPGVPRWWWEEESIVQECLQRRTMLECRTVYAYRR